MEQRCWSLLESDLIEFTRFPVEWHPLSCCGCRGMLRASNRRISCSPTFDVLIKNICFVRIAFVGYQKVPCWIITARHQSWLLAYYFANHQNRLVEILCGQSSIGSPAVYGCQWKLHIDESNLIRTWGMGDEWNPALFCWPPCLWFGLFTGALTLHGSGLTWLQLRQSS